MKIFELLTNRIKSGPDYHHNAYFKTEDDARRAGKFYEDQFGFTYKVEIFDFNICPSFGDWASSFRDKVMKRAKEKLSEDELVVLGLAKKGEK